jgi:hypothetical protein
LLFGLRIPLGAAISLHLLEASSESWIKTLNKTSIRHGQGYENMTQVIARPTGFFELLITFAKQ